MERGLFASTWQRQAIGPSLRAVGVERGGRRPGGGPPQAPSSTPHCNQPHAAGSPTQYRYTSSDAVAMARVPSLSVPTILSVLFLPITESAYTLSPDPMRPDSQRTPLRPPVLLAIQR